MVAHFPEWLEPIAATLTRERFTGPEWVFECEASAPIGFGPRGGGSVSN
jgi:hypothetical protein